MSEFNGQRRDLLEDVAAFLERFIVFPSVHALYAVTLWIAHTHVLDAAESTPRLAILSAEKGSGKTRLMELLGLLCALARHTVNLTPANLFRQVEATRPTLLLDEADTYFGPSTAKEHQELRGLINSGHRRGAVAYRMVKGPKGQWESKEFPAFCAVALAGIGDLPDTITDRSATVNMKRRAPHEHVEPFRYRKVGPQAEALRVMLELWAEEHIGALTEVEPDLPGELADRAADCWEPLVAIADYIGGAWPERARAAAVALHQERTQRDPSLGVRLLGDLRTVFGDAEHMFTDDLLTALNAMEEAPWGDLYGKPLDAIGLARRLRRYKVRPHDVRIGDRHAKGYSRSDLHDAWTRYLPFTPPGTRDTRDIAGQGPEGVTPVTGSEEKATPLSAEEEALWRDYIEELR